MYFGKKDSGFAETLLYGVFGEILSNRAVSVLPFADIPDFPVFSAIFAAMSASVPDHGHFVQAQDPPFFLRHRKARPQSGQTGGSNASGIVIGLCTTIEIILHTRTHKGLFAFADYAIRHGKTDTLPGQPGPVYFPEDSLFPELLDLLYLQTGQAR